MENPVLEDCFAKTSLRGTSTLLLDFLDKIQHFFPTEWREISQWFLLYVVRLFLKIKNIFTRKVWKKCSRYSRPRTWHCRKVWAKMWPWIFWPIFDSSFSYKSAKNENKINLASQMEEGCSLNIQSKNQLDSPNNFLVIVVRVSKKIVFRKTRLKLKFKIQLSLKLCNSESGSIFCIHFCNFLII